MRIWQKLLRVTHEPLKNDIAIKLQ